MLSVCWWFVITQIIVHNNAETRFCSGSSNSQCSCMTPGLCTLQCNGKDICKGSDMKLSCYPGHPCNIVCNSAGEENACEDAVIDGSLATTLNIVCHDMQSCMDAKINCGRGDCHVTCLSTDSTGANCKGLQLNCGPGSCRIECEKGSNICNSVRVNTLLTTASFECIEPGVGNTACTYINNQIAPFSRTTAKPTLHTLSPTETPTIIPSKSPTINPTISTKLPTYNPTHIPSVNPSATSKTPTVAIVTDKPSMEPSVSPTIPAMPTKSPIVTPSPITESPTTTVIVTQPITSDPTTLPSNAPSIGVAPTKPNYYVVGELTEGPTQNENIYAGQSINNGDFMSIIIGNWIYVAGAGGITFCCFILMCVKCCCSRKKVAKPARYNPPGQRKKKVRYRNPKAKFVHVQSSSRVTNVSFDEFIPPPPNDAIPVGYKLSMNDMKEGLDVADVVMPGTLGGVIVRPMHTNEIEIIDDESKKSEHRQLIDENISQIENDNVAIYQV